jgi:hypothetical protein
MKRKFTLATSLATLLLAGLYVFNANAALIGPVYPAPGGNGFSASGSSSADPGGKTLAYSGFNTSAFSSLYWGADSGFPPVSGVDNNFTTMTFSHYSGNTAVWTGLSSYNPGTGPVPVNTELDISIVAGSVSWISAAGVGLPSSIGAVIDDSAGANYSVNLQFLANGQPLNTFPHELNSSSDFSGAFYYAAPVPEPTTMVAGALLLLPFGFQGLRYLRNRKQTA